MSTQSNPVTLHFPNRKPGERHARITWICPCGQPQWEFRQAIADDSQFKRIRSAPWCRDCAAKLRATSLPAESAPPHVTGADRDAEAGFDGRNAPQGPRIAKRGDSRAVGKRGGGRR